MAFPRCRGLRTMELGSPGEMRAELNGLVLAGGKTATAGLLSEYDEEGEELEHVGERMALVDDELPWVGTIEITDVRTTTLGEVDYDFALAEGEGFTSVEHWREGHLRFWTRTGHTVDLDSPVALIRLRVVEGGYPARVPGTPES